jgi:hypothetical protein
MPHCGCAVAASLCRNQQSLGKGFSDSQSCLFVATKSHGPLSHRPVQAPTCQGWRRGVAQRRSEP